MDITITPGRLSGTVRAIPSKSQAHRLLICAAFADGPTTLHCPQTNRDIEATVDCLNALGAHITRTDDGYEVQPADTIPERATLACCESGSTLRFLLPVAAALGVDATFVLEGRLSQRPLSPLWEELVRHGAELSRPTADTVRTTRKLRPGHYAISGSISSQYISGLMFAMMLLDGESTLTVTDRLESAPYVEMTARAIEMFGGKKRHSPGRVCVEGDWSNAAFFLAAGALGSEIMVEQLDGNSPQGDRKITDLLPKMHNFATINASDIPDLVPILSVVAAALQGAEFTNVSRLRLKESDRIASTAAMLRALGGKAHNTDTTLTIEGTGLTGGVVDSCGDHRIAMSAAIAATVCKSPVTILGAHCVNKSYPGFWRVFKDLGGNYEQFIR